MALEDRYDELPDELKERAKPCETIEDVLKLAEESMVSLSDEEVEAISGGGWGGGGCSGQDDCPSYRAS